MDKTNKWKMNRAGIVNFWYYDEEIFEFANGKLLLRGSNGSGKSVTMQSFLPVLLDGRKSPDRLDPFGSRARKMEDYLLGEKEVVDRDERTGYLFIEYKRENTDQYITTGIGLQAKRNKAMKFWGFVLTDNRRVGEDFQLYKEVNNAGETEKIPFSRTELENRVAGGGHVVQTPGEYAALVNKYIFGFETIDAYEDLIKLLIQLRSPKLSKEFRPTAIYDILEAALPPLSDEDLRHLSDTIEHMDQTKQQIEQLDRELAAITKLNDAYQVYNEWKIADQAEELLNAHRKADREATKHDEQSASLVRLRDEIKRLEITAQELDQEKDALDKKDKRLRNHEVWNLENERTSEAQAIQELQDSIGKKDAKWDERRQKELQAIDDRKNQIDKIDTRQEEIEDIVTGLEDDAEAASFSQHDINLQDFRRHKEKAFDFAVWKQEADGHLTRLEEIVEQYRSYDQLKEQYEQRHKDIGILKFKLEGHQREEQEWLRTMEEDKEKLLRDIHAWSEAHDFLPVDKQALQHTSRLLPALYDDASYEDIRGLFRTIQIGYEQEKRTALSRREHDKNQLTDRIDELEAELAEWKQKKDPEPERSIETNDSRRQLKEAGHSFVPFYEAVEFQEHVTDPVRKRLEAALLETGVLDALITEDPVDPSFDKVLHAKPGMMAYTLADYLEPDVEAGSSVSKQRIADVLQSILLDGDAGGLSLDEAGRYQIGLVHGHASPVPSVRFIGRAARKRYREEKTLLLEEEIAGQYEEKRAVESEISALYRDIDQAAAAIRKFPGDADVSESYRQIQRKHIEISQLNDRISQADAELKEIYHQFQEIRQELDQKTRHYNLETSRSAYQDASYVMRQYEKKLAGLTTAHVEYRHMLERKARLDERIAELQEEVDELKGELNSMTDQLERKRRNYEEILQQLEQSGMEDIRKQIMQVQERLAEVNEQWQDVQGKLPASRNEFRHREEQLKEQAEVCRMWEQLETAWRETFTREIRLGFVVLPKSEKDTLELARWVKATYGSRLDSDLNHVGGQLTRVFYNEESNLVEYRMQEYDQRAPVPEWMDTISREDAAIYTDKWKQKAGRRIIELNYQGKQVAPAYVQAEVEKDQARQESLLDEQDRALYEEILFQSVGNKLRARIHRAEQWTKKMNSFMEKLNSSSGLTFSVRWKPRTADSEEEMDTKDLVDLLKRDARTLRDEDLNQIIAHFRSKIEKAKELIAIKGEGQTLLQVLKEVLDYRKWFSFVLSYRREGEPKRELTNHAFYKFSGGEKAMAMYIPLFTACYSRYQEANHDAPYIISLDEAFAGVDENNIREMFEIVEELGFDYIMNSQVLWGDYDTISELSICELVRPKNASFVSVIHYLWDGSSLQLSDLEEAEEQETLL
ncbi:TIGR02680 family protein [Thalassobacillus devorans]|uniref:TIGR02680 family protein n=1 Tax=Thalassobacillus devorans TaxID=279813 RepID=UPI000491D514|nr:TIGR02680 family protein [Thalassobacillus devorans]